MSAYDMSDEDDRYDRWVQLHGPIMEWSYGCYPPKDVPAGAEAAHEEAETFRDAVSALHGFIGEGADEACDCAGEGDHRDAEQSRWEEFTEQLDTVSDSRPFREVSLVGPDGWTYWITKIEH